eukprot:sb/3478998/
MWCALDLVCLDCGALLIWPLLIVVRKALSARCLIPRYRGQQRLPRLWCALDFCLSWMGCALKLYYGSLYNPELRCKPTDPGCIRVKTIIRIIKAFT